MSQFAESLAAAQHSVAGIDTRDRSSLAYAAGLVALQAMLPEEDAAELDFQVSFEGEGVYVEVTGMSLDSETRQAIDVIATHYYQARRRGIPLTVH